MRDSSRFLVHQEAFLFDLIGEVTVLRSQMIASQAVVIKLQEELISCKNQQLESVQAAMKTTVQETVHDTVKTEIKSYSQSCCQFDFEGSLDTKRPSRRLRRKVTRVVISWSSVLLKKRKRTLSVNWEMCSRNSEKSPMLRPSELAL